MTKKITEKILADMSQTLGTVVLRGGSTSSKLGNPLIYTQNTTSLQSDIAMNKQYMASLSCQLRLLISPFNNRWLQWGSMLCKKAICPR